MIIAFAGYILSGPAAFIFIHVISPQPDWISAAVFSKNPYPGGRPLGNDYRRPGLLLWMECADDRYDDFDIRRHYTQNTGLSLPDLTHQLSYGNCRSVRTLTLSSAPADA